MKLKLLKNLLVVCALLLTVSAKAQTDYSNPVFARYGETVADREKNHKLYTFFNDAYAAKNYEEASVHLKELLTVVPGIHQNLYIKGSTVLKRLIAKDRDATHRMIIVDSLMILHDYRIENFGDDAKRGTPYILIEKVKDNINFCANDPERVIASLDDAIAKAGDEIDIEILPTYFNYLSQLFSNDALETDVILSEYEKVNKIIEASSSADKDDAKATVEKVLMASGAASCENLEKIFKPQYEANPDDKDLINKISQTLARAQCSSDFQLVVAEKAYSLDPSPSAAASLAFAFDKKGNIEKALQYYDEAISKETDNANKAAFAISAAGSCLVDKKYSETIKYARQAISIDNQNGTSYFLLAQAQAASLPNCGKFQQGAAFWLIVDNLVRARNLLSGEQADNASKLISSYTSYFPSAEDVFFNDLKAGDSYTVSCGSVSGTTTVRMK